MTLRVTSSHACGIDAYGVRGFGSAMPENKFSVAAFALHAIPAGCRLQSIDLFFYMSMVFLQTTNLESSEVVLVHEAFHGRGECGDGRGDRNAGHDCLRAHLDFVHHGFGAGFGGVHDPLDFLVVDEIQQVRTATGDAEHGACLDAFVVEEGRGSTGGVNLVAHIDKALDERHCLLLVFILEGDEDVAFARDLVAGCELALEVGKAAVAIDAHDFAGRLHFRRKRDVYTRELDEREDGFLDAHVRHVDFFGEADLFEGFAEHAAARVACERYADGLGDKRHRAGSARVHFDHVEFAILHGELHVHEADHVEFLREFLGVGADLVLDLTPLASAAALGHRKMQAFFCDTLFARFSLERGIGGMTHMMFLLLGVPAHICAVGLYSGGNRLRLRLPLTSQNQASLRESCPLYDRSATASLSPTRLVNTSRFWLTGSLSLTRMLENN